MCATINDHVSDTLFTGIELIYRITTIKMWVNNAGQVIRSELYHSTGSKHTDELLLNSLKAVGKLPGPPPADLPQPVKLQITTHTG